MKGIEGFGMKKCKVKRIKTIDGATIRKWLPRRPRNAHKGDFGKILLLCGAVGYTGAPALAAMAAARTGAGLIFVGAERVSHCSRQAFRADGLSASR